MNKFLHSEVNQLIRHIIVQNQDAKNSSKLNKFLHSEVIQLIQHIKLVNHTSIKNNIELVHNIKYKHIPHNSTLASYDITNLYTNIPIPETPNPCQHAHTKQVSQTHTDEIINITTIINQ